MLRLRGEAEAVKGTAFLERSTLAKDAAYLVSHM